MHKKKDIPAERQGAVAVLLQEFETVYEFEECVIMACCDVKFQLLTTMLLTEFEVEGKILFRKGGNNSMTRRHHKKGSETLCASRIILSRFEA